MPSLQAPKVLNSTLDFEMVFGLIVEIEMDGLLLYNEDEMIVVVWSWSFG